MATVVSQLAEPLWTDPSMKSEISVRELISTLKKKKKRKKAQAGNVSYLVGALSPVNHRAGTVS